MEPAAVANKKSGLKPGPGRPKGSTNRATRDVRKAIALLAERNVSRLEGWLEDIAVEDPARAMDLFLRALEYNIPKLSRSEVTGKDGGPVVLDFKINLGGSK